MDKCYCHEIPKEKRMNFFGSAGECCNFCNMKKEKEDKKKKEDKKEKEKMRNEVFKHLDDDF